MLTLSFSNSFMTLLWLRRSILITLWLGLLIFAFGFSPPTDPNTLALIKQLSLGQWQGINPVIIALFNLMGVWPLIFGAVMLVDGQGQKIPAWPFLVGSFFLGAFTILPYLILREPNAHVMEDPPQNLGLWDSPWLGRGLLLVAIACVGGAVGWGDWGDFGQQWRQSQFIAVMSSDFLCLCLAFPFIAADDLRRRHIFSGLNLGLICALPLFGPLLYLACRPPLQSLKPCPPQ
ncbi:MAG: hypothetical protein VKL20_04315 [Synechocystis sp.]|nr:hypothetical protein [Synechocystis sp.]